MHEQHKKSHKEEEKKSKMEKKQKEVIDKEEGEKDKKQKKMHTKELAEKKSKKHKHKKDDLSNGEESSQTMASVLNEFPLDTSQVHPLGQYGDGTSVASHHKSLNRGRHADMQIGSTTLRPTNLPLQVQTIGPMANHQQRIIQFSGPDTIGEAGRNISRRSSNAGANAKGKLNSDIRISVSPVGAINRMNTHEQQISDENVTTKKAVGLSEARRVADSDYVNNSSPSLRLANNLARSEKNKQQSVPTTMANKDIADRRTTGTAGSDETKKFPATKPVEDYATAPSANALPMGYERPIQHDDSRDIERSLGKLRQGMSQLSQERLSEPLNRPPLMFMNPANSVQISPLPQISEGPQRLSGPTNRPFDMEHEQNRATQWDVAENFVKQLLASQPRQFELNQLASRAQQYAANVPLAYQTLPPASSLFHHW